MMLDRQRWIAEKRRLMHRNLLVLKQFLEIHPRYDIVLM